METKIADADGKVDQPGYEATYPPGAKVYFQNGTYAGHETPEEKPQEEEKAVKAQKKQIESKEG
jgi:hypothetical protein